MKTQKVTKSSKFTQASPNENEYRDYQNIGLTILPISPVDDEGNQNIDRISYVEGHRLSINQSSEQLLKSSYESYKTQESMHEIQRYSPERNANRYAPPQDIELCNCAAVTPVYIAKTRFADQCDKSEQTAAAAAALNRSFSSLPKLEGANLSQASLDRKCAKYAPQQQRPKHGYACEQRMLHEMEKTASLRRMQSPEIINIHRGPFYEGRAVENCSMKEFKCEDHGFRRGHSVRSVGSRSNPAVQGRPKRRAAGDGMDAPEMDDPELTVFEMTGRHLGDCQCACDHVVYSPTTYTACLQLVGPTEIEILSINNCHGFDDKYLQLRVNVNKVAGTTSTISGNISVGFDLDDEVKINVIGNSITENGSLKKKTYISRKGFCKLFDNYIYARTELTGRESFKSFCPIYPGFYRMTDIISKFGHLELPYELLGHKIYRIELTRDGKVMVCKEFDVRCTRRDMDLSESNGYNK